MTIALTRQKWISAENLPIFEVELLGLTGCPFLIVVLRVTTLRDQAKELQL
jgi:hypothetical protein